ncbi:MAG: serine protease [Pseudomonadota bacterium]
MGGVFSFLKHAGRSAAARGVGVFLLAAVAFLLVSHMRNGRDIAALKAEVAAAQTRLAAAEETTEALGRSVLPSEIIGGAQGSVYLIVAGGQPQGTAFVIDRENGVLATAAHVATLLDDDAPQMSIVNREGGAPLPVLGARAHKGYGAFARLVEDYQPMLEVEDRAPRPLGLADLACDVALLLVDPIDPETGENRLGADLPLAPEQSLLAMKAGDPIAVLGFPSDTFTANYETMTAAPRADRGIVSAVINPLDIAAEGSDPQTETFISYRMKVVPGNSGGPVLNRNGEVVGVVSHTRWTAMRSGVYATGEAGAQRADLIYDLLTPLREERRLQKAYLPGWRKRLEAFPSAREEMARMFFKRKAKDGEERLAVADAAEGGDAPYDFRVQTEYFDFSSEYFDVEISPDLTRDEAAAEERAARAAARSAILRPKERRFIRIQDNALYAFKRIPIDPDRHTVVFAYDYQVRGVNRPYCPMRMYRYDETREVVVATSRGAAPYMHFKPGDQTRSVNFVFTRPEGCDRFENPFLYGVVSWDDPSPSEEDVVERLDHVADAAFDAVAATAANFTLQARRFVACRGGPFANAQSCDIVVEADAPIIGHLETENALPLFANDEASR